MTPELILRFLSSISPWFIIKVFVVILLFFYILLAGIVVRQVDLMNQVLEAKFSPIVHFISLIHLGVVIFIFFLSLIIL